REWKPSHEHGPDILGIFTRRQFFTGQNSAGYRYRHSSSWLVCTSKYAAYACRLLDPVSCSSDVGSNNVESLRKEHPRAIVGEIAKANIELNGIVISSSLGSIAGAVHEICKDQNVVVLEVQSVFCQ
ncbi:hypothetical protein EJB05_44139, partial [Eragrostis curvula]